MKKLFQGERTVNFSTNPVSPDLSKPFSLSTYAYERGFGVVLEQEGETRRCTQLLMQVSRQTLLNKSMHPLNTLVFAVGDFEVYLPGNKVTVYTDHQAPISAFLMHLKSQTRGLLARWYLEVVKVVTTT